ncbi:hypothetical protein ATY41_12000 [Leifsonia xyli subsp. xyli]|nr:lysylphosphatidylglycerol synthase domain-containing protein [Leifsonia xyli]ODA89879.1 hypothetical protein ATY41_12000 [Leifsonia xyli subsp. xyli]
MLVMMGNLARALRTQTVLDQARPGGLVQHVDALSAGVLFTLLLPLSAGEVVRTLVLSRRLRIGLLYTGTAIALERLLDVIVVAGALLIFGSVVGLSVAVVGPAILILAVTGSILLLFVLLVRENRLLMRMVVAVTSVLADRPRARVRMSVWSTVHGYQSFLRSPRKLGAYVAAFGLSWLGYLTAVYVVLAGALPDSAAGNASAGVLAPFLFPETLLGLPSVGEYSRSISGFLNSSGAFEGLGWTLAPGFLIWIVLTLPTALYGAFRLCLPSFFARVDATATGGDIGGLDHTQRRDAELATFVDSFLRRDDLALALHRLEVRGDLEVVRFFKGGSDAVTALVREDGVARVRKVVPEQHREKLAQQYRWLRRHSATPNVVRALGETDGPGYYSFDIEFDPATTTMFGYLHSASPEDGQRALRRVWDTMFDHVYDLRTEARHPETVAQYLQERLADRLDQAAALHPELAAVLACETVGIAGQEHPGLRQLLSAIVADERAWEDLITYRESAAIHGDLTIDNLLIDPDSGDILIIDPSDDNQVRGPVLDFARHFQSLWGGYEFLNESDRSPRIRIDPAGGRAEIGFESYRSARYQELAEWTEALAGERLTPTERRSLPFHVGLLYGRMLSHRVVIDPATVLVYYARSVQILDRFLAQYAHRPLTSGRP